MAKRGRRPLNRPKFDTGTQELIMKRMTLSPKDHTQSTTPLDVCRARGIISDEAYSAASYFGALRKIVFGKAHPPAVDLTAVSRGGLPEELDIGTAERKYRDACAAMKCQGRAALDAVENIVVHERWPDWLFHKGGGHETTTRNRFCIGVAALLGWYKERPAQKVA